MSKYLVTACCKGFGIVAVLCPQVTVTFMVIYTGVGISGLFVRRRDSSSDLSRLLVGLRAYHLNIVSFY